MVERRGRIGQRLDVLRRLGRDVALAGRVDREACDGVRDRAGPGAVVYQDPGRQRVDQDGATRPDMRQVRDARLSSFSPAYQLVRWRKMAS